MQRGSRDRRENSTVQTQRQEDWASVGGAGTQGAEHKDGSNNNEDLGKGLILGSEESRETRMGETNLYLLIEPLRVTWDGPS